MKANKRISAGKRGGNPAYRTPSLWRAKVQFKTLDRKRKNPLS